MDYNLRILQSRVKQFSVMMVIGLVIQCLPCLVLCARFILLAPSPPNTKKMLWLFTWRIINKSMVVVGYRKFRKVAGHFRQLVTVDQLQTALLKDWKESLPSIILSLVKLLFQPIIARCCSPDLYGLQTQGFSANVLSCYLRWICFDK